MDLTTDDIKKFLEEPKEFSEKRLMLPSNDGYVVFAGKGVNTHSEYLVDVNRKRCIMTRITFQNRLETSFILLRLDIDTKPHRNPDGKVIGGTHLHIYQENYETTWAYELTDPRIKDFLPDYDSEIVLQAIAQDEHGNNKLPIFEVFSNMCKFNNQATVCYAMF